MPIGAAGTTITLDAQYQDGTGAATVPVSPRVSIINPLGVEVVNDDEPTAMAQVGRFSYEFPIPASGPLGTWQAVWTGTISDIGVEAVEMFTVVAAGSISFDDDCLIPLWLTVDAFLDSHLDVTDEDEARLGIAEATWVLNALTGHRFHGWECRQDIYRVPGRTRRMNLEHWPVETVFDVVTLDEDGNEGAFPGWKQIPGGTVRLPSASQANLGFTGCATQERMLKVSYRVAPNLPPGVERVVDKLAHEFWKAYRGQTCALPNRITNVSREGMSWTILDPLDFLDRGLTGIGAIDQWVAAANLKGHARLIDPLTRPPLLESEVVSCGENCVVGDGQ